MHWQHDMIFKNNLTDRILDPLNCEILQNKLLSFSSSELFRRWFHSIGWIEDQLFFGAPKIFLPLGWKS